MTTSNLTDKAAVRTAVVIVNFNSTAFIRECLKSLAPEGPDDIVVLDNHSRSDEVYELRALLQLHENCHLIESSVNLGFGAGVNRAFQTARVLGATHVWILNPDTVVV